MEKIILRHLKGSKAGQMEEFPLTEAKELTMGRESTAGVRFDPDRDDVVGRLHAQLVQDGKDKFRYELVDMDSRNGTFLNRQRITGKAAIAPGDVIQLGAGGPEIQFDIEPRPAHLAKSTRLAVSGAEMAGAAATREAESPFSSAGGAPKSSVGKATVERMITGAQKESKKNLWLVGGAAAALIAAVAIWQTTQAKASQNEIGGKIDAAMAELVAKKQEQDSLAALERTRVDSLNTNISTLAGKVGMTESEISERYSRSVVLIQVGWHLKYTRTGQQVYHRYVGNSFKDASGKTRPIMLDGRQVVAVYYQTNDGRIVPSLTLDGDAGWPIGFEGSGSGFIVTNDGFIVTNRHVASGWKTTYSSWNELQGIGVLLTSDDRIVLDGDGDPVLVRAPYNWVPSEAVGQTLQGGIEGELDYMNVYLKGNTTAFRTNDQPRVSDRHDVALIKIASAAPLQPVELNDNYETIQVGSKVTVLGYPGISDDLYTEIRSSDAFKKGRELRIVPDPTLNSGIISKVIRARNMTTDGSDPTFAVSGDRYQLSVLATGSGNSGGPMFDSDGKVVGIFFASTYNPSRGERVTFAVPIRYAMELIGVDPNVPLR
ncbi:MAG: trypsin-like peptidase domain-containing protein [Gemmatimonadales bacterium]